MPTIQEEISRVKELIFGNKTKDNQINECDSCMDDHHKEHGDSYMAKRQLYTIATKAQSMHDRLEHGEKLEDWMESKIAQGMLYCFFFQLICKIHQKKFLN